MPRFLRTPPFTSDGKQNFFILLEALPQKAQLEYLHMRLPCTQVCSLDLATPRSAFGDTWLMQFIDSARIIREASAIQKQFRHTGKITEHLRTLANSHGISLATLYRLCGKPSAQQLSNLYLEPIFLQAHLPKTMCLRSADFAYALYLDQNRFFSQNSFFGNYRNERMYRVPSVPIILNEISEKRNMPKYLFARIAREP